jgi:hypothetical protein
MKRIYIMKNFSFAALAVALASVLAVPASAVTFKDCNPSVATDVASAAQNIRYGECVAVNGLVEDAGPQYAYLVDSTSDRLSDNYANGAAGSK